MYYLIYTSFSSGPLNQLDLSTLLQNSRKKNLSLGITGILYCFNETFIQLIEGDEAPVKKLYAEILTDDRHKNIIKIKDGVNSGRFFPDWSMAYKKLTKNEFNSLEGFIDLSTPQASQYAALVELFKILNS